MAKYLIFPDEEEYLAFLKNPAKWDDLIDAKHLKGIPSDPNRDVVGGLRL